MRQVLLENEYATIELENGIIIVKWNKKNIDLNVAQKVVGYRLEVSKGKPYPLLINVQLIGTVSKEARDFLASEKGCEGVVSAVVLIDSIIGSMIGNFFISVNKPLVPTKIFTKQSDAMAWLAKYVKK